MKRLNLKLSLAVVVCLFNLFVCFAGVYAWFVTNRVASASNIQVQIYTHELDMSFKVYKWSEDDNTIIDATGRNDALTLQKYDSIIKSRNVNTSIILEFYISGIALGENIPINVHSYCSDATLTNRVISNIIRLQFSPIVINSNDSSEIYNQAISYFDNNNIEEVKFKNNITKSQDVVYVLNDYSDYLTPQGLRLYIRLDYCEELIDEFEFATLDNITTTFVNDLTLIECVVNE